MGLRLVPRGKKRAFIDADELYELFVMLYKDIHPEITKEEFFIVLKEIFPVYKNPRKHTEEYKITTYKLKERMKDNGMINFPVDVLINRERLKIEM